MKATGIVRRIDDLGRVVIPKEIAISDIDLCLFAPAMTLPELLRLGVDIDELLLPWKVDLCLWHQLDNPALHEHIQRVGRELVLEAW